MSPDEDAVWRLLPGWSVKISGNDLFVFSDVRRLKITCHCQLPESLAETLARGIRLSGEREQFPGERALINKLRKHKVVGFPIAAENGLASFSRQAEYFVHLGLDAVESQDRISSSRVLVLGLGGTGSVVLEHLVGAGAKKLVLVDQDVVSASNLERQFIYAQRHVGQAKASAAAEYVLARSPAADVRAMTCRLDGEKCLEAILAQTEHPNLAIVCVDQPPESAYELAANTLWGMAIPFVHGGVMVRSGFFGPLFDRRRSPLGPSFFPILRTGAHLPQATMCYSPYNTIIASAMAADAIHYLAGAIDLVDFERRTLIDLYRGKFSKIEPRAHET